MKKNFVQRLYTSILFAIVLIGGIVLHPISFFIVFGSIVVLGIIELYKLVETAEINPQFTLGLILGLVIFSGNFAVASGMLDARIFYIIIPILTLIMIVELYRKKDNPFTNIAFTIFGALYLSIPFALFSWFVYNPIHPYQYNSNLLLAFFILIWVNDSGAYIVGSLIGKHKLFERISPKKTWEGSFGGGFLSIIATVIMSFIIKDISLIDWINIAFITVIFGTFGDLIESLLKRMLQVKDSGNLLPGHGGILDRFDSIMIAAPMVFIYLMTMLN